MNAIPTSDVAVIGAGVVGLACAKVLAETGQSVFCLEAEPRFGSGISSRNSEVIHGGIYYPEGSLKTRLCIQGRRALYAYCNDRHVPYRKCGKLIVAVRPEETVRLSKLLDQAHRNGVENIEEISPSQAKSLEPDVTSHGALLSRETGIIDSHSLMQAYLTDLEAAGGMTVFNSVVTSIERTDQGYSLALSGEPDRFFFKRLVISGGLSAQKLAGFLADQPDAEPGNLDAEIIPLLHYVAGRYYSYSGGHSVRHLIYPLPVDGGLGIHATLDLAGQLRFGPDARWVDQEDYDLDPICPPDFLSAIQRYMPWIDSDRMQPAYAGIRPKLSGPGEGFKDFVIQTSETHGQEGLVCLYGIESPGLTASLAIANEVARSLI
jgi:L-2-hydroxyglutarate oxidase LhgO